MSFPESGPRRLARSGHRVAAAAVGLHGDRRQSRLSIHEIVEHPLHLCDHAQHADLDKQVARFNQKRPGSWQVSTLPADQPKAGVGYGHTLELAELLVDGKGFAVHLLGAGELAACPVDVPKVAVGDGDALEMTELLVDGQGFSLYLLGADKVAAHPVDRS